MIDEEKKKILHDAAKKSIDIWINKVIPTMNSFDKAGWRKYEKMHELEEKLCRLMCKWDDVDPDGIGYSTKTDEKYPLWQYRLKYIRPLLEQFEVKEKQ